MAEGSGGDWISQFSLYGVATWDHRFGSRARGDAHPSSDLDILVVKESIEPRYRRSVPILLALSQIHVPMDILVYTPQEIEDWRAVPQAFVTTAIREGKVLYERPA